MEWNPIKLGDSAHLIVTKTVHKTGWVGMGAQGVIYRGWVGKWCRNGGQEVGGYGLIELQGVGRYGDVGSRGGG